MSERRPSPRAMLAQVALADLPTPESVRFDRSGTRPRIVLALETFSAGNAWIRHLGGEPTAFVREGTEYLFPDEPITWHGWPVEVVASRPTPPPADPLDQATTTALEGLVSPQGGA